MTEDVYSTIHSLLTSPRAEDLRRGFELVKQEIARSGSNESRRLFEMISTIFYLDPLDRPDLAPLLDEAVSLVIGFGECVIPALIQHLDGGDLKAQIVVGHALGRIGADAVGPLIKEYESSSDPARRAFLLFALGKIKSPKIVQAAPLALDAARSQDRELRDTATRAVGKLAESILPAQLPPEMRRGFVQALRSNLADHSPAIRAKAVRSLGKLAKYGHLEVAERAHLRSILEALLGRDERFEWDHAYVVRREAEEALQYV